MVGLHVQQPPCASSCVPGSSTLHSLDTGQACDRKNQQLHRDSLNKTGRAEAFCCAVEAGREPMVLGFKGPVVSKGSQCPGSGEKGRWPGDQGHPLTGGSTPGRWCRFGEQGWICSPPATTPTVHLGSSLR